MTYSAPRPQIHGHRGCRGLRPENTLPAFLHALELGVDALEMDVIISADQQVVVSHEPWLSAAICRTAQGQRIPVAAEHDHNHNLYRLSYAEIQRCDCGSLKHPQFPEQLPVPAPKPLLREVLAVAEAACQRLGRAPVRYAIEVKSSPAGDGIYHPAPRPFLALVAAEIAAAGVAARSTVLSFDGRVLQAAHTEWPALGTCLLVEADQPWLESLAFLGFVPTVFGPDFRSVSAATLQQLRATHPHLPLVPWTVNQPADMRRLVALGVAGLTTDYPDRARALLGQLA